jgi:hypothetical protein
MAFFEEVSAVLLIKLPPKLKDQCSFTIPCRIGDQLFEHALLDLGAGVNLLPYMLYDMLSLGSFNPLLSPCNWQIKASKDQEVYLKMSW